MAVMQFRPSTDLFGPPFDDFMFRPLLQGNRVRNLLRAPEADVVETENAIIVAMDAPGMSPDDFEIGLENNVLTVSGERRPEWAEAEEARATWHLSERRYGKFSRSFVLPRDVDQDGIQARFDNGVLSVTVPKSERARRRRIQIQNGNGREVSQRIESGS